MPPSRVTKPRRVFLSGQKRGVFGTIKRELKRRSAIEPVIGHMKAEGHLGRGNEDLLDIGKEGLAVDGAIQHEGRGDRVVS